MPKSMQRNKSRPKVTPSDLRRALSDWLLLNHVLRCCTERQALQLLRREQRGRNRLLFLLRVFGRYNVLRIQRERAELLRFIRADIRKTDRKPAR